MPFEFISTDEVLRNFRGHPCDDETVLEVRETILEMSMSGDFTMFYNKENERYFAVAKGQPIPKHMEAEILGKV